jgi:hypothetical protein
MLVSLEVAGVRERLMSLATTDELSVAFSALQPNVLLEQQGAEGNPTAEFSGTMLTYNTLMPSTIADTQPFSHA